MRDTGAPVLALAVHTVLVPEPAAVTVVAMPGAPQLGELLTAELPER